MTSPDIERNTVQYPGFFAFVALLWHYGIKESSFSTITFEIDRRRFAVRLTAPYSDERRHAASELAKGNTNRLRNAK